MWNDLAFSNRRGVERSNRCTDDATVLAPPCLPPNLTTIADSYQGRGDLRVLPHLQGADNNNPFSHCPPISERSIQPKGMAATFDHRHH